MKDYRKLRLCLIITCKYRGTDDRRDEYELLFGDDICARNSSRVYALSKNKYCEILTAHVRKIMKYLLKRDLQYLFVNFLDCLILFNIPRILISVDIDVYGKFRGSKT